MRPEQHYYMTLTWWARSGSNSWGDPTFAAPVPIEGHLREQREIYKAADGSEKVSRAIVHVDRDMTEGDYILLGTSVATDPLSVTGAEKIDGWRKSSVPGKDVHVRRAYL